MKNKINITMKRQEVTDEELECFKDFDSLLVRHHQLQAGRNKYWKTLTPIVVILGALIYVLTQQISGKEVTKLSETGSAQLQKPVVEENPSVARTDSAVIVKSEPAAKVTEKSRTVQPEDAVIPNADKELPGQPSSDQKDTVAIINETKSEEAIAKTSETVYIQAEPVDGYQALYEYFERELIYPQEAVKDSVQGVLTVTFLINKSGKPEQINTNGFLGKPFELEAIRLVENMPLWRPATLNGQAVISKLSLPLTFQLRNNK